jgi:myosin heavy subunit
MAHNYEVGTRAWQPDTAEGWVASEVTKKQVDGDKVKLTFQLDNGDVSYLVDIGASQSRVADVDFCSPKPSRPPWRPFKRMATHLFPL